MFLYNQVLDVAYEEVYEQIGETLKEIYTRAEQEGAATNRVANLIAEERFSLKGWKLSTK